MGAAEALAEVLVTDTPRDRVARELAPFAPLIGSWDLDVVWHEPDGTTRTVEGEWHFGWALDGRALIDVWITPSRRVRAGTGDEGGEWGMSVRFPGPEGESLRSTWLGPGASVVMPFRCRFDGGRIVLEGSFEEGVLTRWMFTEIRDDTFHWENARSGDDGATWTLHQEMRARRRT